LPDMAQSVADIEPYVGVRDAAAFLSTSSRSMYRLVKEPGFPFYRLGGELRFKCSEIEEWMQLQAGRRRRRRRRRTETPVSE